VALSFLAGVRISSKDLLLLLRDLSWYAVTVGMDVLTLEDRRNLQTYKEIRVEVACVNNAAELLSGHLCGKMECPRIVSQGSGLSRVLL